MLSFLSVSCLQSTWWLLLEIERTWWSDSTDVCAGVKLKPPNVTLIVMLWRHRNEKSNYSFTSFISQHLRRFSFLRSFNQHDKGLESFSLNEILSLTCLQLFNRCNRQSRQREHKERTWMRWRSARRWVKFMTLSNNCIKRLMAGEKGVIILSGMSLNHSWTVRHLKSRDFSFEQ